MKTGNRSRAAGPEGARAERHAERWLRRRGLRLLERNWRCRFGEIDLILEHGDALVFVEVRLRRRGDFGTAAASVTHGKRQRLLRAARHYLLLHSDRNRQACRFDVIAIDHDDQIDWIQNAFGE